MMVAALMVAAAGGAQAGDAQRGQQLYTLCQACHSMDGENGVGPSLKGVMGRRAGSLSDFRYSPAMRRSQLVWDADSLERFMADPQAVIRGTRMPFDGVAEAKDREDLAAYLERDGK